MYPLMLAGMTDHTLRTFGQLPLISWLVLCIISSIVADGSDLAQASTPWSAEARRRRLPSGADSLMAGASPCGAASEPETADTGRDASSAAFLDRRIGLRYVWSQETSTWSLHRAVDTLNHRIIIPWRWTWRQTLLIVESFSILL